MYETAYIETEEQLKQVLDFCYGILGEDLRDIENYRYEDWKERLENDNKLFGITRRLMDRFEKEADRAGFRYITLGSDADGFYEKCGYRKICETERQNIYQKLL